MPFRRNVHETRILSEGSALTEALSPWLQRCQPPAPGQPVPVALVDPGTVGPDVLDGLLSDAAAGSVALVVAAAGQPPEIAESALKAAGVDAGAAVPAHPVRLRAATGFAALTARLDDLPEPLTPVVPLTVTDPSASVILTAPMGLRQVPVATWRPETNVLMLGVDPEALIAGPEDGGLRLLHRLLLLAGHGRMPVASLPGVGLLGYGAIGAEHVAGFRAAGFEVVAVCDRSPGRLAAASQILPEARTCADADALMEAPGVGLIAISTPPDSHAAWAAATLAAGHHAVVEKPLALSAGQADEMLDAASGAGLTLAVYQNRRFDPDFLAIQRLVRRGRLGRVFHVEAFVGGYGHPCNYWHSDAAVSGGTAFDWGSHYLDQILALVPGPVEWVRGSAHKLRWHDVTNADQVRIQLRFADGTEAEFVHSDLAAALKPKWYVLGTEGAVVGEWRRERVVGRTPVGLLDEDVLAPADSPATVWLHHPDGSRTEVAQPGSAPGRYHRELADWLQFGEPLTADPDQSRDVVAVLEAAVASADDGGRPLSPTFRAR
ncbi:MAG TPA: Gfo/Idh/MocA family oxidoreductase [Acidimicrobiales bacterium]|nr:Gfo/Idh/MocA family oxidoreductase [Acidimicrobiales bacterium]